MGTQDVPLNILSDVESTVESTGASAGTAAAAQASIGTQSLALVQSTLVKFDAVEAGLADMRTKYKDTVYDVASTEGMADAKAARIAIREPRYAIDKAAKLAKEPLNLLKKDIDDRAEVIKNALIELETPIHEQIKAEEDRLAAEKERIKAEKLAAAARAQTLIDTIRQMALTAATGAKAADIASMRIQLDCQAIEAEDYGDRTGEALQAKMQTLSTLETLYATAVRQEAEAAQALKDRAELESMREAIRQNQLKADEARAAEEKDAQARRDAEHKKLTDELAAQRKAFEEEQREAREKAAAAQKLIDDAAAAIKAEQDRLAAEKQAAEQKRLDDEATARRAEEDAAAAVKRAAAEAAEAERLKEETAQREARQAEQKRLDEEAAARRAAEDLAAAEKRAAEEAAHAADQRGRDAWSVLFEALQAMVNEEQPLGIDRATYRFAVAALAQAEGE